MNTERRQSPRVPVSFDVVLNHRAQSLVCTMRDISLGGAFIDADPELLPYAGLIELSFSLPLRNGSSFVRLPATIHRVTEDGAAVTFGDVGSELYFQLVDMIAVPGAPASRPAARPHS